jgi:hypothetical protein
MIERVAEALWKNSHVRPWVATTPVEGLRYRLHAKAAIAAMREPTPEMIQAAWGVTESVSPENRMAAELGPPKMQHERKMRGRYAAMIDAALASNPVLKGE